MILVVYFVSEILRVKYRHFACSTLNAPRLEHELQDTCLLASSYGGGSPQPLRVVKIALAITGVMTRVRGTGEGEGTHPRRDLAIGCLIV